MELRTLRFSRHDSTAHPGDGAIGVVEFATPESFNAVTPRFALEFDALLNEIAQDATLRVVVVTGSGKAFCAGGNLREEAGPVGLDAAMTTGLRGPYSDLGEYLLNDVFHVVMQRYGKKLERLPQVTIAAVNGWAVGAGLELTTLADIRVASEDARFSEAAVKQGFVTETGGTRTLPALIGKGRALDLILTGRVIDAATALDWGLVDRVVAHDELLEHCLGFASDICERPHLSVRHAKRLVLDYWLEQTAESDDGWQAELDAVLEIVRTEDNREGIRSFLDKRDPRFGVDGPLARDGRRAAHGTERP